MKTLVIYYSRSGTTRTIAEALARELTADLEEIRCERYRSGPWNYLKAIYDSLTGRLPTIERPTHSPSLYDLVVIGGPIWASHVATPVRAFLRMEAGKLSAVAFFVTHGGSPPDKAFSEMQTAGAAPRGTLAVREKDVKAGRFSSAVSSFVAELRKGKTA